MGHSAGAHEAALLTLAPKYLAAAGASSADIVGLVGLSGPYVLEPDTKALRTIFSPPYESSDWQPVRFVHPQAPPTLLLHGLEDQRVLPQQTRQFRDALTAYGVSVEMELYKGASHADTIAAFSVFEPTRMPELERIIGFIRNVARAKAVRGLKQSKKVWAGASEDGIRS
jgi:dipeptidyl aminopeptidase/acylaminoacyl peptidase